MWAVPADAVLGLWQTYGLDDLPRALEQARDGANGMTDWRFLAGVLGTLVLAAALGACIALHPSERAVVNSLEDAEAPRAFVVYAVVGALIGIMVRHFGPLVGVVVFGIGGLIRFRTEFASAPRTGYLILVTLAGLACGLALPHVAVLATAFAWVLMSLFEASVLYRIVVKGVEAQRVGDAAAAYRAVLASVGATVLSERKQPGKSQVALILRAPRRIGQERLAQAIDAAVPPPLHGMVDWEVD